MHKTTSPKRKSFRLYTVLSVALLSVSSVVALIVGVTPATAANLATQPDTQIAVFMVPLTILVLAVLFEVTRIVARGNLPVEAPAPRKTHRHWSPGRDQE